MEIAEELSDVSNRISYIESDTSFWGAVLWPYPVGAHLELHISKDDRKKILDFIADMPTIKGNTTTNLRRKRDQSLTID